MKKQKWIKKRKSKFNLHAVIIEQQVKRGKQTKNKKEATSIWSSKGVLYSRRGHAENNSVANNNESEETSGPLHYE